MLDFRRAAADTQRHTRQERERGARRERRLANV
jgi:hypothetical protein